MREIKNRYNAEVAVLTILGLIAVILFGYTSHVKGINCALSAVSPQGFIANFFGGPLFFAPFMVIGAYLLFKLSEIALQRWRGRNPSAKLIRTFKGIIAYLVIIGALTATYSTCVNLIFLSASPQWVVASSQTLMDLDLQIFGWFTGGQYPAFLFNSIGNYPNLEELVLLSYSELVFLISALFFGLFLHQPSVLRRFVLTIFLCGIFSLPIWLTLPSVSPHHLYRINLFKMEVPGPIQDALRDNPPSPRLAEFLEKSDLYWIDPADRFYPVSANPSMHIAWAVVIWVFSLVYARWASRELKWSVPVVLWTLLIPPWFALNAIATMYAAQHYAVDLIFGGLIALLAIGLATRAVPMGNRCGKGEDPAIGLLVRRDLKQRQSAKTP